MAVLPDHYEAREEGVTKAPVKRRRHRMTLRHLLSLVWKAMVAWFEDSAPRHGAAIAYYTLFAIAPVLVLVIGIAGLVFGEEAVRGEIVGQIAGLIGREGAEAVQSILQKASEPREGIGATVLGLAGLIFAATGAFLELQAALNKVWEVKASTNGGFDVKSLVVRRLRSLGVVVSIGFLLMVSLAVNAAVQAAMSWFGALIPGWPVVVLVVNQVVSLAVSAGLFGILFRVLPDVRLSWRDVAIGSIVTAVLFAVGQRLIGLYLGNSTLASPFGAAGTIAIILVWVYYSTQIVLFGAELTRVLVSDARGAPPPDEGAVKREPAPA
jgi:membrane protein